VTRILRLAYLICFASMLSFAANLSGWLVNSKCYASMESNRSEPSFVNWDQNLVIRYCSPNKNTRSFAVVGQNGLSYKFDAVGNEKAIDLGLNSSNKLAYVANVTGSISQNTVNVRSVSISARISRHGKHAPGL
jgi:hypothetical protein